MRTRSHAYKLPPYQLSSQYLKYHPLCTPAYFLPPISQGACDPIRLYAKPRLTNPHYYTHVIMWCPTPFRSAPIMPTTGPISNNIFYNGCCYLTEPQAAQNARSPNTRTNPTIGSKAYILTPKSLLHISERPGCPNNTLYLPRHMVRSRG